MTVLTISQKGWVVIPAELRRKYDLHPGRQVQLVDYGGVLALIPTLDDPITEAAGMLRGVSSLTKRLIADHVEETARER
ncbi:MAG TPA: AbrB/MazE/SpoVT family DNA-binding domain-containing protein [Chloroflexi bacterium]|jgi:AbrB family looped-hinge helix DNA binding protein|nr:AbrB/MazE/SpoVT family DNA-binding domain-containing protein [Chloroflexota bacterium]